MFKNRLKEKGFSDNEIDGIMQNSRASMDGQVPAKLSFEDWVRTKPPDFQNRVFGAKRAQLFRDGKLQAKDLLSQEGHPLTLKQIAERANAEDPSKLVNRLRDEFQTKFQTIQEDFASLETERINVKREMDDIWKEYAVGQRSANWVDSPERQALIDRQTAVSKARADVLFRTVEKRLEARAMVVETLSTGKKTEFEVTYRDTARRKGVEPWKKQVETGVDWVQNIFGGQVGELSSGSKTPLFIYKLAPSERSHHFGGTISISGPDTRTATAVAHEMGHWLEYTDPRVKTLATDFLKRRIGDATPKWLGSGFRKDEIFVKDDFFDNYMGKVYPKYRATEITSMGLDFMMKDPVKFWTEDPDYFYLMLQILRGA
jgi:hypothetical protein